MWFQSYLHADENLIYIYAKKTSSASANHQQWILKVTSEPERRGTLLNRETLNILNKEREPWNSLCTFQRKTTCCYYKYSGSQEPLGGSSLKMDADLLSDYIYWALMSPRCGHDGAVKYISK